MRPAAAILISLALGAATTIAVAWSLALYAPPPARSGVANTSPPRAWPRKVPGHWGPPDFAHARAAGFMTRSQIFTGYRAGGFLSTAGIEINQVGWPLRSMEWEHWFDRQGFRVAPRETLAAYWLRDGIEPPAWLLRAAGGAQWRRIPVDPVWPGFAANTAFASLLAWTVLFSPGVVRRGRRRRRGWCIACGYDLAALPRCPECGRLAAAAGAPAGAA